ncbi:hypothetical protein OG444_39835 (plasmid) [Streptomyces sp. NBC_01232]|uniref:hypothetical protein n=1 Tax=Streptomyces sp. NBC_01232 TaxID=2903786 RepID=UPI002E163355|nr:hypothetical protein OG444_39835 [Streptomyces sp. NBC_01232]
MTTPAPAPRPVVATWAPSQAGPCAKCGQPCAKYGSPASPLCVPCQKARLERLARA